MIFRKIKLKNFRQYKNEVTIDFAVPDNNNSQNITLVMADNGVGKTTLLQSIRYCFFGSSANYLNLPEPDNLLNNSLQKDLKEVEEAQMFVEVEFYHEGNTFIARREEVFQKLNGKINSFKEERFILRISDEIAGYRDIDTSKALDKMHSILPPGLSYIFMFDGERMERNITDRAFKSDLKESILGILDIKKYDELIDLLGTKGKSSTVIGKLYGRRQGATDQDNKIINENKQLEIAKQNLISKISEIDDQISVQKKIIDSSRVMQSKIEEIKKLNDRLKNLEKDYDEKKERIDELSEDYISKSLSVYINKILNSVYTSYNDFANKDFESKVRYRNLHIDTIEDILSSGICLCGEEISVNHLKRHKIESLKSSALPFETAHNLSEIQQMFNRAKEFNDMFVKQSDMHNKISGEKYELEQINGEIKNLEINIKRLETEHNINYSSEIDKASDKMMDLRESRGEQKRVLDSVEDKLRKQDRKLLEINQNNIQNKKIMRVIEVLEKVIEITEKTRDEKNKQACETLGKHFQETLSKVMQGKYRTEIDEFYNIKIFDINENDVTSVLSTGQNVVVSISLISALIETAKELSNDIDKDSKYGIIMDAALSNLDSTHINRLSKHSLNNMEQLIFLSFKKQLKNELIASIGDNVGKAYELYLNEEGSVDYNEIELVNLSTYINESGEL
ncbi:AAA family ATPase [Haploplasma modicum]|uniref:AAA family ATPase n=1 Tax=Haploplasma modicum TaxID=2150 RepID=UPI00047A548F|nr:AAA family ATPase [Haploplasma modicum]